MIILPIDELMWPGLEKMKISFLEKNEIYFGKYFFPINWQSRQAKLHLSWVDPYFETLTLQLLL